ncbi:homoserine/homoserine lactone efflux protein [Vibrio fluvialis]|jgi:homoserine/homoserine lactone efflux protein|uniref:Homoserine/homoserine lactone efflux protein n=2 Tax=Vibrio fluvialis TaxID=676 RepID=A0AAX2LRX2_VIBFL|nr:MULTISPECIES: homoserine/homoserine lactone efflux protein [Vibrio]TNF18020.1 MAG: homoserine/homoserine lactone efflux protein [Vibrionaceae bacterium]HDM8036668.1 homoserine/homoserine lactone efflux protein [Vibrio fluvialis clinical-1]AMF95791.1 homoserine/homoserine lactone efflux protein [Vibrio fluvialis]AVH31773.1 homoserine/homoserine lactone efflux protein [Vibrio fluvialis]EKO3369724.1 homoserine/homoserine lactone efflux protein [Vibrio fluvialis]
MDTHVWLAYVATAIVFSLAPGSGTVNSISNGLSYGTRKSLASIAGLQIGLAIHIMLVGAGIGALVAQSALAFTIIKWVGAVYLVWLGIQKWRDRSSLVADAATQTLSAGTLLRKAVLINLTNPKSIVFLVALFPQFLDPARDQMTQLLVLGITTVTIDSFVMLGYTSLASQMGRFIRSDRIMRKINRVFGSMFMGCGALLAAAKA